MILLLQPTTVYLALMWKSTYIKLGYECGDSSVISQHKHKGSVLQMKPLLSNQGYMISYTHPPVKM